jgi:hypothetical protein
MNINELLRIQLITTFRPLNVAAATFPPPRTLSVSLEGKLPKDPTTEVTINPKIASHFASAAVDIWLRSVHSFLISASLTEISPIWSSVSGYYSSHYAVRGLAHLLGYFQLFRRKRLAKLSLGHFEQ